MKKKFLAFLLVAVLAVSSVLTGCGSESGDSSAVDSSAVNSTADSANSTADESTADESQVDDVDYDLPTTAGTYTYKDAVGVLAVSYTHLYGFMKEVPHWNPSIPRFPIGSSLLRRMCFRRSERFPRWLRLLWYCKGASTRAFFT